jgi:hypothetical protein
VTFAPVGVDAVDKVDAVYWVDDIGLGTGKNKTGSKTR